MMKNEEYLKYSYQTITNYIMKKRTIISSLLLGIGSICYSINPGTRFISSHGYENCIEISNSACRVVLEPNLGGRILVYEINGKNALYVDLKQNGLKFSNKELETAVGIQPCAGRFDVGPEQLKPSTKLFWQGQWKAEIIGQFSAKLSSQIDKKSNLQLFRSFELDPITSKLTITQTIKNHGVSPQKLCYWSRTFATGGGICIVPLSVPNRFPKGYIEYGDGNAMRYRPDSDENIKLKDNHLLILGPTKALKFVFDSNQGWMGYITKDDMLFVKSYVYNKLYEYGEMAAVPLSIFYSKDTLAELEPIGPWQWVEANGESSFSEIWQLHPYKYPTNKEVNIELIKSTIR